MNPIESQNCPHCGGVCAGWLTIVASALLVRWLWVRRMVPIRLPWFRRAKDS
ncbi:MAG: hypothetical protein AAFZ38_11440 [Myxococcota bacterium]